MAASYSIRLAAWAGWIAFIGIVASFIVIPMAIAGQPPTSATGPAAAMAYFRHPEFALINGLIGMFVGVVAFLPFGWGLRAIVRSVEDARSRTLGDLAFAFLVVALPVYVVSGSFGAMLVDASTRDPQVFTTLFRWYDVLYNGAADVLEGAWIGAFSIAMLGGSLPRWLAWLGIAVGASRWIKALAPFASMPDAVAQVSGVLFAAWFLLTVVAVTRYAMRPPTAMDSRPVPA